MDCSKTINFFHELKGLCDEDATRVIEIVQKWSDEHPKKTYIQDFFEKFPKAKLDSDGTPFACRKKRYGGVRPNDKRCDRRGACNNCWNEPMEE